jgi:hypothetical protein
MTSKTNLQVMKYKPSRFILIVILFKPVSELSMRCGIKADDEQYEPSTHRGIRGGINQEQSNIKPRVTAA